jgi:hypothetical protein
VISRTRGWLCGRTLSDLRSPEERVSPGSSSRWRRTGSPGGCGQPAERCSRTVRRSGRSDPRRRRLRCWRRAAGRCPLVSSSRSWWTSRSRRSALCLDTTPAPDSLTPKFSRMRRRRNSTIAPPPGAACRLQRNVRPARPNRVDSLKIEVSRRASLQVPCNPWVCRSTGCIGGA